LKSNCYHNIKHSLFSRLFGFKINFMNIMFLAFEIRFVVTILWWKCLPRKHNCKISLENNYILKKKINRENLEEFFLKKEIVKNLKTWKKTFLVFQMGFFKFVFSKVCSICFFSIVFGLFFSFFYYFPF